MRKDTVMSCHVMTGHVRALSQRVFSKYRWCTSHYPNPGSNR